MNQSTVLLLLLASLLGVRASEEKTWWAFAPLAKVSPPACESAEQSPSNAIDRFVLHKLSEHSITPAPRADKHTLIRRLYFDLIGMPPTADEIAAFVSDEEPDAWERLVDTLLASPRYGEHWSRFWLDLVRYSESDGWNQDAYRPHIWRYRDYVVNAFNENKPYPEFVLEQLAGDELPADDPSLMAAAGFMRLGIYEYNQRDARGHWNDIMNEMTDVAGDVFLGISLACARCHDHKFDPIPQTDYFKMRAFFEPVIWRDDIPAATKAQQAHYQKQLSIWKEATQEIQERIDAIIDPYHERKWEFTVDKFPLDIQACFHTPEDVRTSRQHQMAYLVSRQFLEEAGGPLKNITKEDAAAYESLKKELAAFDHLKPKPLPALMTVTGFHGEHSPTTIPYHKSPTPIAPGFLTALGTHTNTTQDRSALARWIGRSDNPLTMRVIVNRLWQQHFGRGIVATPNDFGLKGQLPTHPELLDWLTFLFIENGGHFKELHRLILTSSTWRQSSRHPHAAANQAKDPAENLLWRAPIRRLKAEQIRDAMLLVSDELRTQVGGPSIDENVPRRALYLKSFRNQTDSFLHAFDLAPGLKSVADRNQTTTPTQSLTMMNGPYVLQRAQYWGKRLQRSARPIEEAMIATWGRKPTSAERKQALAFVDGPGNLIDFCHLLFNSSEFLYLE